MLYSYHDLLAVYEIGYAHPGGRKLTEKLLNAQNILTSSTVLDSGCGSGETSIYLASAYQCKVFAIEKNEQMAVLAQAKFKHIEHDVELVKGNVEDMPYEDEFFDLILSESVTAFTEVHKTLSQYNRILKINGVLLLNEMTIEEEMLDVEKDEIMNFYGMNSLYTENEWREAIKKAGFKTIEVIEGKSIMEELESYTPIDEDSRPPKDPLNKELKSKMAIHHDLTLHYADVLGYRVFKVTK